MNRRKCTERGSGVFATGFGAVVFLAFVALGTHTLVSLYATSVLNANVWDQTRSVAASGNDPGVRASADAELRRALSGYKNLEVSWMSNGDESVGLRVGADRPMFLPPALARHSSLNRIERTVWVRNETFR